MSVLIKTDWLKSVAITDDNSASGSTEINGNR